MNYKVVVEPQEEGGYTVYVPTLPGCVSQGDTVEEAVTNIKEAIQVYLESLKERGIALPRREILREASLTRDDFIALLQQ